MAKTPEGKVKDKVKALLKKHGAYYHMPVQNGMGKPSLDFVGCHDGRFFAVETKAPKKDLTPRQETTKEEMEEAGGVVFVVRGDEGLSELEYWLESYAFIFGSDNRIQRINIQPHKNCLLCGSYHGDMPCPTYTVTCKD